MKTYRKIPIVCLQLLLVLGLFLGTQATVKADQYTDGVAAYSAGDYQKALEIFQSLAEQGDAQAQYQMGFMYDEGKAVPQDYMKAAKWFRKAAEKGDGWAQYNLGIYYKNGKGIPQNYMEAVKWFRKAAEKGDGWAQFNLGIMYITGRGVLKDYVQAHKWFDLAASRTQGEVYLKAVFNRKNLAIKMTPSQLAEAQKLAREWKPKPAQ